MSLNKETKPNRTKLIKRIEKWLNKKNKNAICYFKQILEATAHEKNNCKATYFQSQVLYTRN